MKNLEKEAAPPLATYSVSWEEALRGGTINMLLINLASSLAGYPGPPTQTDREQIKEMEGAIASLVKKTNEIIEKNDFLESGIKKAWFQSPEVSGEN